MSTESSSTTDGSRRHWVVVDSSVAGLMAALEAKLAAAFERVFLAARKRGSLVI
jgi:hypothetical protein